MCPWRGVRVASHRTPPNMNHFILAVAIPVEVVRALSRLDSRKRDEVTAICVDNSRCHSEVCDAYRYSYRRSP